MHKMKMLTLSQKIDSTDDRTAWEKREISVEHIGLASTNYLGKVQIKAKQ